MIRYADASALVKLVVGEPETEALDRYLGDRPELVTSHVARVEVVRAARQTGVDAVVVTARSLFESVEVIVFDDDIAELAAELEPVGLRSLDAIHVASALVAGHDVVELLTYDRRMADAARVVGLAVASPT